VSPPCRKQPPAGWLYTGVDMLSSLNGMLEKLQAGGYDSEFALQQEIYDLAASAYGIVLVALGPTQYR